MVTRAEQSNEESMQDSEENFTEADSMAAEVGEDDVEEEEVEAREEADDEGTWGCILFIKSQSPESTTRCAN